MRPAAANGCRLRIPRSAVPPLSYLHFSCFTPFTSFGLVGAFPLSFVAAGVSPVFPSPSAFPQHSHILAHTPSCLPDIRHDLQHDPVLRHPQEPRDGLEAALQPRAGKVTPEDCWLFSRGSVLFCVCGFFCLFFFATNFSIHSAFLNKKVILRLCF